MKKKEVLTSITKSILGAIPYAGTGFNEAFFEYRNRIKQERANSFVKELFNYMDSISQNELFIDQVKQEEFGDIFESIIKRVSLTRSAEKRERFKMILAGEIINPSNSDFIENYLDLIEKLNETQIRILINHKKLISEKYDDRLKTKQSLKKKREKLQDELNENKNLQLKGYASNVTRVEHMIGQTDRKLAEIERIIKDLNRYKSCDFYNISAGEYIFFVQDLVAKSLLIDAGIGGIGTKPYEVLSITEYAQRFLEYIEK